MSETLTRIEVNCATGEQKVIPLTAEEIAQREADAAAFAAEQAEREAAEAFKREYIHNGIELIKQMERLK